MFQAVMSPVPLGIWATSSSAEQWSVGQLLEFVHHAFGHETAAFPSRISESVRRAMTDQVVTLPARFGAAVRQPDLTGFSLGAAAYKGMLGWTTTKEGTTTSVRLDLARRTSAAASINCADTYVAERLANELMRSMGERLPRVHTEPTMAHLKVDGLAGAYECQGPMGGLDVSVDSAGIRIAVNYSPTMTLIVALHRSDDESFMVTQCPPALGLAVLQDPQSQEPVILINNTAFRKRGPCGDAGTMQ
jgi:hypothetical protein